MSETVWEAASFRGDGGFEGQTALREFLGCCGTGAALGWPCMQSGSYSSSVTRRPAWALVLLHLHVASGVCECVDSRTVRVDVCQGPVFLHVLCAVYLHARCP